MAVKDKKARFNPFVLPSDFFKSDGDPVYLYTTFLLADMIEKCGSASTKRKLSAIVLFGPNNSISASVS